MKRLLLVATILLPTLAVAAADGVQIYRPEAATGQLPATPEEGITVKTLTIQKGDSLSKLSRRYAGKGYYFPQILLFNRISNPDLIIAGESLRVPLPPSSAGTTKSVLSPAAPVAAQSSTDIPAMAEKKLFAKAKSQYRKRHYKTALGLFDRYIHEYPDSPQAGNAIFHRGECYLKLSRR